MRNRFLLFFILRCTLMCLLPACVGSGIDVWDFDDSEKAGALSIAEYARWKKTRISVCWENPDDANYAERQWVRDAVLKSWEAVSALHFTGWQACRGSDEGIRIRITDQGPHTKGLGRELDGQADGMVLNFSFEKWSRLCSRTRSHCIRLIAIHEFGHALGFAHEQTRLDRPPWCLAQQEGGNDVIGDTLLSPWDEKSVMNYCNPHWNGDGQLSFHDIKGVQRWYRSGKWVVQTGTVLGETDDACQFLMGDTNRDGYGDLVALCPKTEKKSEVSVLSGKDRYQSWLSHSITPVLSTSPPKFLLGDVTGDGRADLVVIDPQGLGTKSVEVHVLPATDHYTKWGLHTGTPLPNCGDEFDFSLGDVDGDGVADLVAIKKAPRSELHILSGRHKFQKWIIQTEIPLSLKQGSWRFFLGDLDKNGMPDLVAVLQSDSSAKATEMHVLTGPNFQSFLIQTPLQVMDVHNHHEFALTNDISRPVQDLVLIKKHDTDTHSTEVHVLDSLGYLP
jgi:hypothetical protein